MAKGNRSLEVVCIDDKNQPTTIPKECLVQLGETYTVTEISRMAKQSNVLAYSLKEIVWPTDCKYQKHLARRFRPKTDDDLAFEEELKEMLVGLEELVLV